jgi:hypothetical protein
MLVEVGGNVLRVGAALVDEPLDIGHDGHLVVGPVGKPDELGAVGIGHCDQLGLDAAGPQGLDDRDAEKGFGRTGRSLAASS